MFLACNSNYGVHESTDLLVFKKVFKNSDVIGWAQSDFKKQSSKNGENFALPLDQKKISPTNKFLKNLKYT